MIIGTGVMIKNTKYPVGWEYFSTIKTTLDYTITRPGWYRFHVVGAGGGGGAGGRARTATNKTGLAISSGGCSGSTGAYAVHDLYLEYGQNVSVEVVSGKTALLVNGAVISAVDGIVGFDGYELYNGTLGDKAAPPAFPAAPTGVVAVGGNVANINGVQGNGSRFSGNNPEEYVLGGRSNPIPDTVAIYTPKTQTEGNAESTDTKLGGSGAGGEGIATFNTQWVAGTAGWRGGLGGVVLERGSYG